MHGGRRLSVFSVLSDRPLVRPQIGCPTCTGVKARAQVDTCGKGMKPTVCDPRLRTYNKGALCGSAADTYQHNPWRAPNSAPVFDPCVHTHCY